MFIYINRGIEVVELEIMQKSCLKVNFGLNLLYPRQKKLVNKNTSLRSRTSHSDSSFSVESVLQNGR